MRLDATRRHAIGAGLAAFAAPALAAESADPFAAVEARTGGRVGVAALDTASGARLGHRAAERFAMCSTFKAMAAAAVLARVDRGVERLDRFVPYAERDLLDYAPVTRRRVKDGGMPLGELCAAAVELSDNTAANLILAAIGGPAGWTGFVRTLGDTSSRLDRIEPAMNTVAAGETRDTTTPLAMLADLQMTVLGKLLTPGSRERLAGWMVACQTGTARLRAGLPKSWRVGDKTGALSTTNANDIAVIWTATAPIVIASYIAGAKVASGAELDGAHAEIGAIVARAFRPAEAGAAHG
ncbi:MAG: class A beta-lactamase [Caulobacterales bacterium]